MNWKILTIFLANALISCAHQTKLEIKKNGSSELTITAAEKSKSFSREDLLNHPMVRDLKVTSDPAYGSATYRAVPMYALLESFAVNDESILLFTCLDGFSAPINLARLLNQDPEKAIAYLAIEPESEPWPRLRKGSAASAGPFYVVWENPEKSRVSPEEWPFQIVSFSLKPPPEKLYPHTSPDHRVSKTSPVYQGYQAFLKNCFACHTMNGEGDSRLGPDLNIPFNPTEYLQPGFLKKLIRNPQAVRLWPKSSMAGFNSASLTDQEIRNIILYLHHMALRKHRPGTDSSASKNPGARGTTPGRA